MSILQTVAMATNNRKDNHFYAISTYLLPFLELTSVKCLKTRQSCENDFGQYFNLKKNENLSREFLKIVQFHIFDLKKSLDKILLKNYIVN